jgi:hypothetical protein
MESSPSPSPNGPAVAPLRTRCLNLGSRFDTKVEVRVNPCIRSRNGEGKEKKKKFTVNPQVVNIEACIPVCDYEYLCH